MQRGDRDVSALSLPAAGPNAPQKHIKAFVPRAGQAATQSGCSAGHGGTIGGAGRGRRGCCPRESSPPISCPPSHLGVIFKGVPVSSVPEGDAQKRGRRVDGLSHSGRSKLCPKDTWAPWGWTCVLRQGTQVPPCPALVTPGPAQGLMYPRGLCKGPLCREWAVLFGLMVRDEFTR